MERAAYPGALTPSGVLSSRTAGRRRKRSLPRGRCPTPGRQMPPGVGRPDMALTAARPLVVPPAGRAEGLFPRRGKFPQMRIDPNCKIYEYSIAVTRHMEGRPLECTGMPMPKPMPAGSAGSGKGSGRWWCSPAVAGRCSGVLTPERIWFLLGDGPSRLVPSDIAAWAARGRGRGGRPPPADRRAWGGARHASFWPFAEVLGVPAPR